MGYEFGKKRRKKKFYNERFQNSLEINLDCERGITKVFNPYSK